MALRELNLKINITDNATSELENIQDSMDAIKIQYDALIETTKNYAQEIKKLGSKFDEIKDKLKNLYSYAKNNTISIRVAYNAANLNPNALANLSPNAANTTSSKNFINYAKLAEAAKEFTAESIKANLNLKEEDERLKSMALDRYPQLASAIEVAKKNSQGLSSTGSLTKMAADGMAIGLSIDFLTNSLSGIQQASAATKTEAVDLMHDVKKAINSGSDDFFKNNGELFQKYSAEFKRINETVVGEEAQRAERTKLLTRALTENFNLDKAYLTHLDSTPAKMKKVSVAVEKIKEAFGGFILDGLEPMITGMSDLIDWFSESENALKALKLGIIILGAVVIGLLVAMAAQAQTALIPFIIQMGVSLWGMAAAGWAAISPWLIFIAIGLAVTAVIVGIGIVIHELFALFTGGETIFGDFFLPLKQWIDDILAGIDKVKNSVLGLLLNSNKSNAPGGGGRSNGGGASGSYDDVIITKTGQIIRTSPDDNLIAVKRFSSLEGGKNSEKYKSVETGKGIEINISNITLGASSTKQEALDFVSLVKDILNKEVAPMLRVQTGVPEAV